MLSLLASSVLEKALNQCLRLDPETLAEVSGLEGKVVALEVTGLGLIYLVPVSDGVRVQTVFEGEPDVTIQGGPFSLLRMGLSTQPASLFGEGVEMTGDVRLGRKIQHILEGLDLDWEEQLSHFTGDIVAHQVGNMVRNLFAWSRNTATIFGHDVAEFFQEERRDLVVREEVSEFLDAVDALRSDVDRLNQRSIRLQALLQSSQDESVQT